MQQFVEAGHDVTLLIGDFTALIGDPSGRNDSRPPLTREEIAANMQTYAEQAGKVLDLERVTVRYNSEWLGASSAWRDLITTAVADDRRADAGARRLPQALLGETPISLHEFLYPVAQAYDSVALESDVELGGDDQLFNFLLARTYQANAGQPPQICMTLPILEGTDGKIRMGKSKGNYIGLTEPPRDQFGKTMSIPDELIPRWARLADFRSQAECDALERGLRDGSRSALDEKKVLARNIVARYHGADAARDAQGFFESTVQRKEVPKDLPVLEVAAVAADAKVVNLMVSAGLAESGRAAQRLIAQGAVRIDGEPVSDPGARWPPGKESGILQVGSRRIVRVHFRP